MLFYVLDLTGVDVYSASGVLAARCGTCCSTAIRWVLYLPVLGKY